MSMSLRRSLRLLFLLVASVSLTGVCSTGLAQEKEPSDVIKVNTDLVVFDAQIKVSAAKKRKEKPVVLTKKGYYLRRK
jgi:hypothetical protein